MRLALRGLFTWLCESPGEEDKLSAFGTRHNWACLGYSPVRSCYASGQFGGGTVDLHRADQREGWCSKCWSQFCFVQVSQSTSEILGHRTCKNAKNSFPVIQWVIFSMTHLDLGMPNWRYLKQHEMTRLYALFSKCPLFFPPQDSPGTIRTQRVSGGAGGALGAHQT